jgi:hypothetical protein
LYSAIEECKIDALGMFFAAFIAENEAKCQGTYDGSAEEVDATSVHVPTAFLGASTCASSTASHGNVSALLTSRDVMDIYVTHFTSLFRSIRFCRTSPLAQGSIVQLNWLIKHKAVFVEY